jgi:transposase
VSTICERHGCRRGHRGHLAGHRRRQPDRLRSEAAWAHLCGVAPIEASSGKVTRYRLNRGGDRQANSALWNIVITRMRSDPRTRAYVARRLVEGRSKTEIIRVLKRYVAHEVYRHLPRA